MPYTLTFHTFIEKRPAHGEEIVLLKRTSAFTFYGYEASAHMVEYCYFEYDGDTETGNQCRYDPLEDGEPEPEEEGYSWRLYILVDGYIVDDPRFEKDYLWMSQDDYFAALPGGEED